MTLSTGLTVLSALAAVCLMAAAPLQAEDRGVTLQEIMALARENNGDLKALRDEAGIGEAARIRSGLYPNPVLEIEGETGEFSGSASDNRISVGLSQEFLTGGKRGKRLAVAEAELARQSSRLSDAERLLLLEVKSGFYDLQLAQGRLDLAQRSVELNSQLLQVTKELLAAGEVAELDLNLVRVEAARSEGRMVEAERELVLARLRLLSLIGSPLSAGLKIAGSPERKVSGTTLAELKALALERRPDLRGVESEKSRGEAELVLARAGRLPDVTAGVTFSRESTVTSVGGMSDRDTAYLIGLRLSIPIPLFDRNQAAVTEATARQSSAETRQLFLRQSIEREVEAADARLEAAEKSLEIYSREIIPRLNENLKLLQQAYGLGEVGILAVIEEQKKFMEVSDAHLVALQSRNMAIARLEAAVGQELDQINGGGK